MDSGPQTWHYGLIARWWAEFHDGFRSHEIPYFQRYIERAGEPGARCRVWNRATALALPPRRPGCRRLRRVRRHDRALPPRRQPARDCRPRCGCSRCTRSSPRAGTDNFRLRRVRARKHARTGPRGATALPRHLLPGGTLLLDIEVPYADTTQWRILGARAARRVTRGLEAAARATSWSDGAEYALRSRIIALDPLEQRATLEMRAAMWRDATLQAEEAHLLHIGLYFRNEVLLMLDRTGFTDVVVQGDHNDSTPRATTTSWSSSREDSASPGGSRFLARWVARTKDGVLTRRSAAWLDRVHGSLAPASGRSLPAPVRRRSFRQEAEMGRRRRAVHPHPHAATSTEGDDGT